MTDGLNWKIFEAQDYCLLRKELYGIPWYGSDTSPANLYFLQKKYDIRMCRRDNFLFRYYSGASVNRLGYGFPFALRDISSPQNPVEYDSKSLAAALKTIIADAKTNNREPRLILVSERQKAEIDKCLAVELTGFKIEWVTERNDSDYMYSSRALAELKGKTYHKKKNHLSRFMRIYENRWKFKPLNEEGVAEDIVRVSSLWMGENGNDDLEVLRMEHESIEQALNVREIFSMIGGVLYVDDKPVAMTMASPVNSYVVDVHFEKCLGQYAANGGYAAINWCFANTVTDYEFLNREEDMGVEGLRKAKLSYHPDIILDKWYGVLTKC